MRSTPAMPAGAAVAAPLPLTGLVAVLTLVSLELVRTSGPLLDTVYNAGGVVEASRAALLTYAAPGAVAAILLLAPGWSPRRTGRTLLVATGLLAALRLLVQALEGGLRVVLGLGTVAVAVAVLCLAVAALAAHPGGGRTAATALVGGAAGAVGLQLTLGTWDAYWRHTALGWAVASVIAAALVGLATLTARLPTSPTPRAGRLWALGPWLALAVLMLANPAFAAAQAGVPLALAGPVHGLGLLVAAALVSRAPIGTPPVPVPIASLAALVGLVLVGLLLPAGTTAHSAAVLLALLGAQLCAAHLLTRALTPASFRADQPTDRRGGSLRLAGTATVVGLTTIAPVLVHQLDYSVPLGFPHDLVLAATAAALGVAAVHQTVPTSPARAGPRPVLLVAGGLLLLGGSVGLVTARQPASAAAASATGRVVSWNVHYGVDPTGAVNLEALARTIETSNPDVVLLQEVSRGWVQGGGADMATWLSQRLDRPFVFGPAADGRFGNVILARGELVDAEVLALPFGSGPQHRSALSVHTRVGGVPVIATSIHLQHRPSNSPTRVRQVQTFLDSVPLRADDPGRIVGGDLNATPGQPEVDLLTAAGFVSAIDAVGDPAALTDPSVAPRRRIDWVFGRGVGFSDATVLTGVQLSDHLPLVVTADP